jgi:RimJ/RimL family protein N-acetyltransferase
MKLNEEELSIIPSTPRYAKDHMDIYRNAEGYLDQFLDIDKDLKRYTFKDHNDWIQSYKREKEDNPTFFIKYWKKVVGILLFREAYFVGGVQISYLTHRKFAGKGITSIALEQLAEVAFMTHKFLHIELHIDIDNLASQRVAEKLGFEVIDAYDAPKMGLRGSGHLEIWAKSNPHGPSFWRQIPKEEWMKNNDWVVGNRHASFRKNKRYRKVVRNQNT